MHLHGSEGFGTQTVYCDTIRLCRNMRTPQTAHSRGGLLQTTAADSSHGRKLQVLYHKRAQRLKRGP